MISYGVICLYVFPIIDRVFLIKKKTVWKDRWVRFLQDNAKFQLKLVVYIYVSKLRRFSNIFSSFNTDLRLIYNKNYQYILHLLFAYDMASVPQFVFEATRYTPLIEQNTWLFHLLCLSIFFSDLSNHIAYINYNIIPCILTLYRFIYWKIISLIRKQNHYPVNMHETISILVYMDLLIKIFASYIVIH